MARTANVPDPNESYAGNAFYVLTPDGSGESVWEPQRGQLTDELRGDFLVAIRGYTDRYERAFNGEKQPKTKVLFEVLEGPFKNQFFAVEFGDYYGSGAHLGRVLRAALKQELPVGEFEWSSVHGLTLWLMVKSNKSASGRSFVNFVEAREHEAPVQQAAPAPAPAPAAPAAPSYNPFNQAKQEFGASN